MVVFSYPARHPACLFVPVIYISKLSDLEPFNFESSSASYTPVTISDLVEEIITSL